MEEILLVLLGLAVVFGGPLLGIIALVKIGGLRREVAGLKRELKTATGPAQPLTSTSTAVKTEKIPDPGLSNQTLSKTKGKTPPPDQTASDKPEVSEPEVSEKAAAKNIHPDVAAPPSETGETTAGDPALPDHSLAAKTAPASKSQGQSSPTSPWKSFEEAFTRQWLVWLGSLTVIIGGIFLIKYSIENQLLSPGFRLTVSTLLGIGLMFGGEWLRRRPIERAIAALQPNHVPPALTAAGLAITYGSIYAAYGLYDLLPPLLAFILLTLVALAGLGLSLLQGPFIAAMGMLGAFVLPLLVSTGNASAWSLFSYLTFISASALAVVRFQNWWWLGWSTLAGLSFWQTAWILGIWENGDLYPLVLSQLLMLALFIAPRYEDFLQPPAGMKHPFHLEGILSPEKTLGLVATCAVLFLQLLVLDRDGYSGPALSAFFLIGGVIGFMAFRLRHCEILLLPLALVALSIIGFHPFPDSIDLPETFFVAGQAAGTEIGPLIPPELGFYLFLSGVIALLAAGLGFWKVMRAQTPAYFAALSAAVPFLALLIVYLRLHALGADLAWSGLSILLALAASLAVKKLLPYRDNAATEIALGVYALAVLAAIGMAFAITLEKTGLTIALALLLPSAAWVHGQIRLPYIRPAAFYIALVVAIRLTALNHFSPDTPLEAVDAFWLLYSFGIPALAFAAAAWLFKAEKDDQLITLLESGALAITVALVSLEIRYLTNDGSILASYNSLLEQSLQSLAWLITGCFLYYRNRITPRFISNWGSKILLVLAAANILLFQVLANNPLFSNEFVGNWPLFNLLSLAYLLPGLLAVVLYREARNQNHLPLMPWLGGTALLLVLLDITLEVRRAFHPDSMATADILNAEGYSYSLAWLVYAGLLLAIGILRDIVRVRHASLAMVLLVIAKVFLWDMAALSGLYRVASFIGLGLCLIGIGFLYQRFVFPIGKEEPPAAKKTT
ncbi:DUF2339 domain-containing protein [Kiloniella laminariae]|uniref:DUF2339 domain-containing protein n=1 Tax=Kiloniella laminariae TaxID=454162 RepID=A0ABT4LJK1_9PROT|nr:DUF2339 domain-containing protein [Kiloniella laminariae]MCZ4281256.1 DUF2339 domain-containing protein [Kiloniella laminariae]